MISNKSAFNKGKLFPQALTSSEFGMRKLPFFNLKTAVGVFPHETKNSIIKPTG